MLSVEGKMRCSEVCSNLWRGRPPIRESIAMTWPSLHQGESNLGIRPDSGSVGTGFCVFRGSDCSGRRSGLTHS